MFCLSEYTILMFYWFFKIFKNFFFVFVSILLKLVFEWHYLQQNFSKKVCQESQKTVISSEDLNRILRPVCCNFLQKRIISPQSIMNHNNEVRNQIMNHKSSIMSHYCWLMIQESLFMTLKSWRFLFLLQAQDSINFYINSLWAQLLKACFSQRSPPCIIRLVSLWIFARSKILRK